MIHEAMNIWLPFVTKLRLSFNQWYKDINCNSGGWNHDPSISKTLNKAIHRVPTAKEILFSSTFPGKNYHFPGLSIQDLKVINQHTCEKVCSIIDVS